MFSTQITSTTQNQFYKLVQKWFRFDRAIKIVEIDFSGHWITLILARPWFLVANLLNSIISTTTNILLPVGIAWAVGTSEFSIITWVIAGVILAKFISYTLFYYHPALLNGMTSSLQIRAYSQLLLVDPLYHTYRSSGQIISKINRGAKALHSLLDILIFDFISIIAAIIAVSITIFSFDATMGIASLILLVGTSLLNFGLFRLRSKLIKPIRIRTTDKATAVNVESMHQATYIRSVFSTSQHIQRIHSANFAMAEANSIGWRLAGSIIQPNQILLTLGGGLLVWSLMQSGLQTELIIGIAISYFSLSSKMFDIGRTIDQFFVATEDLDDLFKFISNFGSQTFPVID